jgi:PadR family transcriptional regulator PadR
MRRWFVQAEEAIAPAPPRFLRRDSSCSLFVDAAAFPRAITLRLNIGFYIGRIRLMLTYQTALVLEALAAGRHHGWDIMDATDLPSGTVYPILRRIEEEGLVRARWEKESEARREQRPPRRYYELTPAGVTRLGEARARFRAMTALGARMQRGWKPA